jgi:Ran GTPase-activating protein (RanGAP) involved in mRNA processing and transport
MMGSRGARALIDAKSSMPCLTKLTLDANGFPEDILEELKECYGDILVELEEWEEDDMDDDLEEEESDEEDDDDDDNKDDNKDDSGVEGITSGMSKAKLTPSDVSI